MIASDEITNSLPEGKAMDCRGFKKVSNSNFLPSMEYYTLSGWTSRWMKNWLEKSSETEKR